MLYSWSLGISRCPLLRLPQRRAGICVPLLHRWATAWWNPNRAMKVFCLWDSDENKWSTLLLHRGSMQTGRSPDQCFWTIHVPRPGLLVENHFCNGQVGSPIRTCCFCSQARWPLTPWTPRWHLTSQSATVLLPLLEGDLHHCLQFVLCWCLDCPVRAEAEINHHLEGLM